MRRRVLVQCVVLIVAGASCVDPVEGPPPPVEVIPAFVSTVVERGIFVDWSGGYQGLTLIVHQDQPHLFYVNYELDEIRYAGCPASCDEERFWVRGTVDTSVWAFDYDAAGAASLDSLGTLHALYGRRFYAQCRGHCDAASSWTSARIDTARTADLALAAEPDGRLHVISILPQPMYPIDTVQLDYAMCAAACTDSANWQHATIAAVAVPRLRMQGTAIIRDAVDRLHVTFMTAADSVIALRYGTCGASCLDPQSWSFAAIDSGPTQFAFDLASTAGRVDLIYAPLGPGTVQYATCSVNCASSGAWQKTSLGTLQGSSHASIAANADVRAVAVGGEGISVWRCTTACGSAGSWEAFRFDTLASYPGYHNNIEEVSIALDPAGQPLVARYGWGLVKYFRRNY